MWGESKGREGKRISLVIPFCLPPGRAKVAKRHAYFSGQFPSHHHHHRPPRPPRQLCYFSRAESLLASPHLNAPSLSLYILLPPRFFPSSLSLLSSSSVSFLFFYPSFSCVSLLFDLRDIETDKGLRAQGFCLSVALGTMSACKDREQDPRIEGIASSIRVVPNFPKPGIMFQDITTLLLDPKAFKNTVDLFVERYTGKDITVVAGIEARGFIFGPPIALAIGAKFIPLRKPRKLPGEVISEEYVLEYGTDCLQMHIGAVQPGDRALIVDDLIATGGTLCAAIKLLERAGAEVVECACVIELPELKGRERLNGKPLYVLVESW
ncbi:putative Adenine phosphoribosyltransferase 3 [Cocos nucifera]|uniref:adenine phosphoribosyltransferase n=1 Tax=Cocos nucifera TaxID=13894 RepID=A0A8K0IFF7_COCNU|nr:putative Adenine phosphoribosyltransferase 3 [Cocos nucifera]